MSELVNKTEGTHAQDLEQDDYDNINEIEKVCIKKVLLYIDYVDKSIRCLVKMYFVLCHL